MHIDDELVPHLEILIDCIKLRGKDIEKQVQNIIGDTELMDQCLEDTFLQFKLHSKKVRDEYKKAVNEEIARSEAVWEKCNELIQDSRPTIENVKKDVKGLLDMLEEVEESFDCVPIYKAEKLLELIEKFNKMPAEEKQMLSKLLEVCKE